MSDLTHIRCLVGQKVYYKKMPNHTCIVTAVHDTMSPILYDLAIELATPGSGLQVQNVFPYEILPIDEIVL